MGLINTEEASLQHAERSQENNCCPKLSFKIKKTTGDNFGQLIELYYIATVFTRFNMVFPRMLQHLDATDTIGKNRVKPRLCRDGEL